MWRYYRQVGANGIGFLFRQDEKHEQVYRAGDGWKATTQLSVRKSKGQIDKEDLISEDEALQLIRLLSGSVE
jgi:hypothetical protein